MLSIFKQNKIKKQLDNILENKKFDFEKGENFVLEKDAKELEKNIYLFTASSQEKRQTIVFRLEITATQSNVWVYYVEGFNRYYLEQTDYTTNCPLKIYKEENEWNIVFAGYLKKNNNKDLARLSFAAKFTSNEKAFEISEYYNTKNIAQVLKKEKDNDMFYNELTNKKYNEYHQFGKIKGKIIVEGQNSPIDLACYRKHTYGNLDWNLINNNMSFVACDKKNNYLFDMISLPSISIVEASAVKEGKQERIKSINNKYERQLILKGAAPENLNILFNLENEENVGVHAKKVDDIKYSLQDGEYAIIIGVAEFLINGKNYRGIFELGYNKDRNRWFNGKEVSKLF